MYFFYLYFISLVFQYYHTNSNHVVSGEYDLNSNIVNSYYRNSKTQEQLKIENIQILKSHIFNLVQNRKCIKTNSLVNNHNLINYSSNGFVSLSSTKINTLLNLIFFNSNNRYCDIWGYTFKWTYVKQRNRRILGGFSLKHFHNPFSHRKNEDGSEHTISFGNGHLRISKTPSLSSPSYADSLDNEGIGIEPYSYGGYSNNEGMGTEPIAYDSYSHNVGMDPYSAAYNEQTPVLIRKQYDYTDEDYSNSEGIFPATEGYDTYDMNSYFQPYDNGVNLLNLICTEYQLPTSSSYYNTILNFFDTLQFILNLSQTSGFTNGNYYTSNSSSLSSFTSTINQNMLTNSVSTMRSSLTSNSAYSGGQYGFDNLMAGISQIITSELEIKLPSFYPCLSYCGDNQLSNRIQCCNVCINFCDPSDANVVVCMSQKSNNCTNSGLSDGLKNFITSVGYANVREVYELSSQIKSDPNKVRITIDMSTYFHMDKKINYYDPNSNGINSINDINDINGTTPSALLEYIYLYKLCLFFFISLFMFYSI